MTSVTDKGEGTARATQRSRRWWGLMLGSFAVVGVLSFIRHRIWPNGAILGDRLDPTFAIWGAALVLLLGGSLAIAYHRIIDEQEERAALWGMTVGFYMLAFGSLAWFLLHAAKLVPLTGFLFVFVASAIIAAAVQLWLQFR